MSKIDDFFNKIILEDKDIINGQINNANNVIQEDDINEELDNKNNKENTKQNDNENSKSNDSKKLKNIDDNEETLDDLDDENEINKEDKEDKNIIDKDDKDIANDDDDKVEDDEESSHIIDEQSFISNIIDLIGLQGANDSIKEFIVSIGDKLGINSEKYIDMANEKLQELGENYGIIAEQLKTVRSKILNEAEQLKNAENIISVFEKSFMKDIDEDKDEDEEVITEKMTDKKVK